MSIDDLKPPPRPKPRPPEESPPSEQGKSYLWVKVLIVIGVVVASWFIIDKVIAISREQDCGMQGRKNCKPIDTYGK